MRSPSAEFWRNRAVALTGGTGFVGHHVAMLLAGLGARVRALVRNPARAVHLASDRIELVPGSLDDRAALAELCAGADVVFHLAGAVDFGDDLDLLRRINVGGVADMLAAAQSAGARRFIHTSSIVAVHAATKPAIVDETALWNLGDLDVPYAATKRAGEELALAASVRMPVVVVNPACVVGPDDYSRSEFGVLCQRFWKGRIPFHYGGGNNFVDVRDVALGHLLAAEHGRSGERYLLAGVNLRIGEFFARLAAAHDRWSPRIPIPLALAKLAARLAPRSKPGKRAYITPGQVRMTARYFFFDHTKATRELGYLPRDFAATLRDTRAFWIGDRKSA